MIGAIWSVGNDNVNFSINTNQISRRKIDASSVATASLQTSVVLNDGAQSWVGTNGKNYVSWSFYDYASTGNYKAFTCQGIYEGASGDGRTVSLLGGVASNSAIDSFTFFTTSSYTFSAGTIKIYGVN